MIRKYGIGVFALFLAIAAVAFTNPKPKVVPSKFDCVWYKYNPSGINPKTNVNNYTQFTPVNFLLECPNADVLCAICLPENTGTHPTQNDVNGAQNAITAAEASDTQTAGFIELRSIPE